MLTARGSANRREDAQPVVVEGQVIGGIVQGLGQALLEHALLKPQSGSCKPRASWLCACAGRSHSPFDVIEQPVPTHANPLGAKGAGESGATGAPPAIMNAGLDALRSAGVAELDSPASAARVCGRRWAS